MTGSKIDPGPARRYRCPLSGYAWHEVDAQLPDKLERVQTGNHVHLKAEPQSQRVKIIDHPGVYMVGYTAMHEGGINSFLKDHDIQNYSPLAHDPVLDRPDGSPAILRGTDSELLIELAGRLCYMSYDRPRPGGLDAFLLNLKSESHGSCFEHPHYSFILSGVSRNLTLEGNRHRTFSISQLSGRFVDAYEVGFIGDPDHTPDEGRVYATECARLFKSYEARYEKNYARQIAKWRENYGLAAHVTPSKPDERKIIKKARERARDILPGALETRIMYTVNTRAIRFIIEKRCHADAAFEIRRAFNGVYRLLKSHDPKLFSDFEEQPLEDGTFAVSTKYPKI